MAFHVVCDVTLVRDLRIGSSAPTVLSHGELFSIRELVDGIRQWAHPPTIAQPIVVAAEKPATPWQYRASNRVTSADYVPAVWLGAERGIRNSPRRHHASRPRNSDVRQENQSVPVAGINASDLCVTGSPQGEIGTIRDLKCIARRHLLSRVGSYPSCSNSTMGPTSTGGRRKRRNTHTRDTRTPLHAWPRDVRATLSVAVSIRGGVAMHGGQRRVVDAAGHGARHRVAAVALIAVGLTGSACGGATQPPSTGSTTSPSTGAQASTSTTSSGSTQSSTVATGPDDQLAWVPFGPDDPAFPTPGWDVYYHFLAHDCDSLRDTVQNKTGHLYQSAVAVCYAAVDVQQSQWDVAAKAFKARTSADAIGPAQCVDDTIAGMVATLLAWHDSHPGRRPHLTFPQTADRRTACSRDHNSFQPPTTESTTTTTTRRSSTTATTTSPTTGTTTGSR